MRFLVADDSSTMRRIIINTLNKLAIPKSSKPATAAKASIG